MTALIDVKESIRKLVAVSLNGSVSRKPVQICLHTQDAIRPGTRTGKCKCRGNSRFEKPACGASQSSISRNPENLPKRPQCAPMAIVRADILKPFSVVEIG